MNKTDSAVRLTHLPTGIVVECQDERSQHKNRARAMSLLQAKLMDAAQQQKQQTEQAESRRSLVGSGDRSQRIRTYNYPARPGYRSPHRPHAVQARASSWKGRSILIIQPLIQEHQADQLGALGATP